MILYLKKIYIKALFIIYWKTINRCFQKATDNDSVMVQNGGYTDMLNVLCKDFQPDAVRQTQAIAICIGECSNQNFFALWYFARYYIAYKQDEGLDFETIKMPNYLWQNRITEGGDCEDKALFVSGILKNWKVEHEMIIEEFENLAHIYIQTIDGIIIDPCCRQFNKQVRNGRLPLAVYRKKV